MRQILHWGIRPFLIRTIFRSYLDHIPQSNTYALECKYDLQQNPLPIEERQRSDETYRHKLQKSLEQEESSAPLLYSRPIKVLVWGSLDY